MSNGIEGKTKYNIISDKTHHHYTKQEQNAIIEKHVREAIKKFATTFAMKKKQTPLLGLKP
eukprot:9353814-Ditylum_brightwellii.AAC.1